MLYTAADIELDERHVIKNEKVALDKLPSSTERRLFLVYFAAFSDILENLVENGKRHRKYAVTHVVRQVHQLTFGKQVGLRCVLGKPHNGTTNRLRHGAQFGVQMREELMTLCVGMQVR